MDGQRAQGHVAVVQQQLPGLACIFITMMLPVIAVDAADVAVSGRCARQTLCLTDPVAL